MLFKDEVPVSVKAGKGGDGAVTFRKEKFVPYGGPDGGDGGDGGDLVIRVNPHLRTLSHIHNNQKFAAENGQNGMGSQKFGRRGRDFILEVPQGTVVMKEDTKEIIADLVERDSECVACHGGKGGKGNVHFKSSTNQTPFYAQKGKPGEEFNVHLELKMIAHIGLVGFPNAGKSTLVSRITHARPKIGNYPFTTLEPNIGVMTIDDAFTSVLIADIPGLIEGAHLGKGLGIEFLKHIERTRLILFLLDATDAPMEKLAILKKELESYSTALSERDFIIAVNKMDMVFEESERQALEEAFAPFGEKVHYISALAGMGLTELKQTLYRKYLEAEKNSAETLESEMEGPHGDSDFRF